MVLRNILVIMKNPNCQVVDDTLEMSNTLNELLERVRTSTNCEAMNKKKSDDDDDRRIERVDLTNHTCSTHGCSVWSNKWWKTRERVRRVT